MIAVERKPRDHISQGDVYRDIDFIEYATEGKGKIEVSKIRFPTVIVLTQDCDLKQDSNSRASEGNQDKYLLSVLVAPLYNVEHVYAGEHLIDVGIKMSTITKGKTPGDYLVSNQRPRYHHVAFPPETQLPPSVIDFKHYFSVNVVYLQKIRKEHFVCHISELYREDISQRFASFLSRIGLPDNGNNPPRQK